MSYHCAFTTIRSIAGGIGISCVRHLLSVMTPLRLRAGWARTSRPNRSMCYNEQQQLKTRNRYRFLICPIACGIGKAVVESVGCKCSNQVSANEASNQPKQARTHTHTHKPITHAYATRHSFFAVEPKKKKKSMKLRSYLITTTILGASLRSQLPDFGEEHVRQTHTSRV